MNYLMLVIDGWVQNPDYLPDYFYREFIEAEKKHIGWKEFITNLQNVIAALRKDIDKPYFDQLHLWYQYDAQQRERGEPVGMAMPEKTDSGIPLFSLTDQKYTGHIWGRDVDYIEKAINEGCEKLLREKGLFPLFFYAMPEKNINPSEAAIFDPLKMQRVIELTQELNDLYFKKELQSKEPEQITEYLDFHLRCYLRNDGKQTEWIEHTKKMRPDNFSPQQNDAFETWMENNRLINEPPETGEDEKYKTLKEVFINDAAYIECMQALRDVKNPVISDDNRYLLGPKQKGAFTAWYEVIVLRQKFKPGILVTDIVHLLNKEIEGLKLGIDGSTLRRKGTTMYNKYYTTLTKFIV